MIVIPLVAIIMFVVAFRAHVPDGVKWAGFILLDVVVQVVLGLAAHGVAALGWLHGPNALLLFALGIYTARPVDLGVDAGRAPVESPVG